MAVLNSTVTKSEVEEFVANLTSEDPVLRQAARESLVAHSSDEGTQALVAKLSDPRQHVRWEAAKTLATLADPDTAPALAHALEDDSEGVRWLAAEGLIALGKAGLTAVLFALMTRATSVTGCRGAHHVLRACDDNRTVDIIKPVLIALSESEPGVSVPPAAYKALLELKIGLGPKP
jgi:HEAT repeat protein